MLILGIVIVLVAIFAGAFIHPLLFLLGLSVIIVALVADCADPASSTAVRAPGSARAARVRFSGPTAA
jgi:hypothetical protein